MGDGRWSRVMVKKLGIRDREVGGRCSVFKVDGGTLAMGKVPAEPLVSSVPSSVFRCCWCCWCCPPLGTTLRDCRGERKPWRPEPPK